MRQASERESYRVAETLECEGNSLTFSPRSFAPPPMAAGNLFNRRGAKHLTNSEHADTFLSRRASVKRSISKVRESAAWVSRGATRRDATRRLVASTISTLNILSDKESGNLFVGVLSVPASGRSNIERIYDDSRRRYFSPSTRKLMDQRLRLFQFRDSVMTVR